MYSNQGTCIYCFQNLSTLEWFKCDCTPLVYVTANLEVIRFASRELWKRMSTHGNIVTADEMNSLTQRCMFFMLFPQNMVMNFGDIVSDKCRLCYSVPEWLKYKACYSHCRIFCFHSNNLLALYQRKFAKKWAFYLLHDSMSVRSPTYYNYRTAELIFMNFVI